MPDKFTEKARWPAYVMALSATVIALALRLLFDPSLGESSVFSLLFAAVAISVWLGGWRPAVMAMVVGYLGTNLLFVDPRGTFKLGGEQEWIGSLLYLISCAVIVATGETLHLARRQIQNHLREIRAAGMARQELMDQVAMTLHNIAEAFSRYDRDWVITYANEEQKRADGRIASAFGQQTLWDLWPSLIGTPMEAALRRCMDERVTVEEENYDAPFDRWSSIRAYPANDGGIVMLARDITQQKLTEQALRKGEEDYRRLFEGSAVGNSEVSYPEGKIIRVNRRFCDLLGYRPDELVGKSILDITHPEDQSRTLDLIQNAASTPDGRFENEKRYLRRDGSAIWVHLSAVAVYGSAGEVTGLLGSTADVTERRETAQALLASEARSRRQLQELEGLYSTAPVGMGTCGPDMRFIRINQALAEIGGQSAPDPVGRTIQEVFPTLSPTIEPYFKTVLQTRRPLLNCDIIEQAPTRIGYAREWRMTLYPLLDEQGAVLAVSGIVLEVTARKHAERNAREAATKLASMHRELEESYAVLDTLLASAPIGLAFVDREFRFVRINEALAAINGARVAEHAGRTVAEMVPKIWPSMESMYRQALEGRAVVNSEMPGEVPSTPGQQRFWLVSCYPARVGGSVIGVGTVVIEVTSQRLATEALKDADRRKDEFLATLAHELRNPLAPVRSGMQLLKLAHDKTQAFDRVHPMMERQMAQMVRLIDDLLDVSRISQGKINLRIARVALSSIIESSVETSRPLIESSGHTLNVIEGDEPVMVEADAARLAQVFSNLLNNAARYTPAGGIITLSAEIERGMAEIRVRDDGIGVPSSMLGRIFDMFTQVDRSPGKSQQQGGLGIGLALVKGLVEMHGGTVEAVSPGEGLGSTFIVRIPAVSTATIVEPQAPLEYRKAISRRVLVADDNEDAASTLALVLEMMGHEVRTAFDGLQAVEVATSFEPDLVLLDIGMPGIDGYEACRRIRRLPRGQVARVVAMTGWGQEEDRRLSHDAGFDEHLVKPADPADIERLLDSMDGSVIESVPA